MKKMLSTNFIKNKKLLFVELTKENYQDVLFDRNNVDIFILCKTRNKYNEP